MTALWEFRACHFKAQNGQADYITQVNTMNKVLCRLITLVITQKPNDSLIVLMNPEPFTLAGSRLTPY